MTVQLTITLSAELAEAVQRAVSDGRAASASDYIADSIAMRERLENLQNALEDWNPATSQSGGREAG
jgi:Arc/MetJ-type ribon-helix-helix transcriptional regulator